uniref:Uncharacterized protein n=1 Tax=Cacopsylla melanoneura TaxID=428564 RepID=A0A8D8Z896_9HEMI
MQIIHVLFLVQGYYFVTNGLVWKRNSAKQWEAVINKKPLNSTMKTRTGDLDSSATGNVQYQQEEQLANGTVVGKYGVLEPNGNLRLVHYTTDKDDFKPKQESVAQVEYVAEDTLKNVNPKDLKLHNQLADMNSIKAGIVPSSGSASTYFLGPQDNNPLFERGSSSEGFLSDTQGHASSYRPHNSMNNVYQSKYYPDYYQGANTYYTGGSNCCPDSRGYGPDSRGYGLSFPAPYPGYTYNTYGPTLPTKYHHTSQLYPKVEPPPIPNYYPLYDVPTPKIPTVSSYPCCG